MLKGLANVGNTCSINTLIQCIGHCPVFLDFILHQDDIQVTKIGDRNYSVYIELKEIFKHLWVYNHSIVPRRFIDAFYESIGDSYRLGDQLDFTEMWMLLLNNILEETHSSTHVSNYQISIDYKSNIQNIMQKKVQDNLNIFFKNTNSPLNNLLQGSQIQQITCSKCNHHSHSIEPVAFTYIDNSNILEGLQTILETQNIKDWTCEKCSYNTTATKFIRIWKLPNIWMIVLQRYYLNTKTTMPINIPTIIPIDKNVEMGLLNKSQYELKSIANHYGSLEGGHYTAVCKNNDGCWCEYNDLKIGIITDINSVLIQNKVAYALFYERV